MVCCFAFLSDGNINGDSVGFFLTDSNPGRDGGAPVSLLILRCVDFGRRGTSKTSGVATPSFVYRGDTDL